jgi:CHAD domain-containing protein
VDNHIKAGNQAQSRVKPSEREEAHPRALRPGKAASTIGKQWLPRVGVRAIKRQLKKIGEAVPAVLANEDPEDVHQMRVAARRVRTYFQVLEDAPLFRARRLRQLSRRVHPLATALGDVRDLDILLRRVEAFAESASPPAGALGTLRDELLWQRVKARRRLQRALGSRALRRVLRAPRKSAQQLVRRGEGAQRVLVRHFAGDAIWRRYEAVLSFEGIMPDPPAEELHGLRIACKRLRYTLELFDDDDQPASSDLQQTLVTVQDRLGELQDSIFALRVLTNLRYTYPTNTVIEEFARQQDAYRDEIRSSFAPYWEKVSGSSFSQALADLIAAF